MRLPLPRPRSLLVVVLAVRKSGLSARLRTEGPRGRACGGDAAAAAAAAEGNREGFSRESGENREKGALVVVFPLPAYHTAHK